MWEYNHTSNLAHSAYADRPYYAVSYDDELYHYGILGMKWGVRKERPTSGTGRGRGRKKLTARQKKIIRNVAIGAGITGAAIGGGILLSKTGAGQRTLAGLRRYKQAAKATKGMSEGQLRLMRQNGGKVEKNVATGALKFLKGKNAISNGGQRTLAGVRRYGQAMRATKGMSEGQLRLMRANGGKVEKNVATGALKFLKGKNAVSNSKTLRAIGKSAKTAGNYVKTYGPSAAKGAAIGTAIGATVSAPVVINKKWNEKAYNKNEQYKQQMGERRDNAKTKLGKAYYQNQYDWAHRNVNDQVYLARKRKGKI